MRHPDKSSPYTNTFSPGWHDLAATWIRPIEANARIQADLLRTSSPVIRDAIKVGKLKVEAAMYDLATAKVTHDSYVGYQANCAWILPTFSHTPVTPGTLALNV